MAKNPKHARESIEQMYMLRDRTGDITFLVESERIRAHRIVLAAQSPKYMAQFYGPHPDKGEIRVPDVSAAAFNVFLQFFYEETVDLTMDNVEMVLDLAIQSMVDDFIECCVDFLRKSSTPHNLLHYYGLAISNNDESLHWYCEERISTHLREILASDDFLQCDREMLLHILKIDTLDCTESYLFYACLEWARAYCRRNGLDDGKLENLRAALGDAIYQIRFSSFNAETFAVLHESVKGFFKHDESIELFYITTKMTDFKSPRFNTNPRKMKSNKASAGPSVDWSLEYDRFMRMNKLPTKLDVTRDSCFIFNCDKPIRFHGFALGMHFKNEDQRCFFENARIRIKTKRGDQNGNTMKGKVYQSPARHNETLIIFEKPFESITHFECYFQLPIKKLNYQLELHRTARENDIVFNFSRGIWVTRLFFDKYSS